MVSAWYKEIDKAITSYEVDRHWHEKTIDWICNRIDWAWKWRKITEDQMVELTERICVVMNSARV